MKIKRRLLIPLLLSFAAMPLHAADKISIDGLSDYLNALKFATGKFTQINSDGSIGTGKIFIHRPGRIRFEYDPPEDALVMAGGQQLAVFDPKSNQPPEQFPLKRTPLHLILKRRVNLAAENMLVAHEFDGTSTSVVAQDPERPELGNIRLVFSGPPVELRQWVITGDDGQETTVILGDMDYSAKPGAILFNIPAEIRKRGF